MPLQPKRHLIETQESLRLVTAFRRIKSDQARARVIALAEMLADIESPEDDSGGQDMQTGYDQVQLAAGRSEFEIRIRRRHAKMMNVHTPTSERAGGSGIVPARPHGKSTGKSPGPIARTIPMDNSDELIRQRAYELWEQSGKTDGSEMDFWLQAERELAKEAGQPVPAAPSDLPEGKLE